MMQVSIVEIKDTGGNVTVIFTVEITAADKHILNDHVQRMIAQLSTKQVRLGNAFGDYQLLHWTLVLGDKRSSMSLEAHRVMAVTIAIVIIVVLGLVFGVYLYNRRYRNERYMSIQQSIEMSDQT
ncbi:hypothetical protein KP509_34G015000 [Ceratopteris richardii]|uniref:Uncharacterized protein n=1 Tax=Ceratopteris richardii TaxID=49495 RepID=A0A8T2QI59_CERRI|nr:hypothetical protein KP509_34G015000 [Ceratopteris richardii]